MMAECRGEIAGTSGSGRNEEPSQRFVLAAYATVAAAREAFLSLPSLPLSPVRDERCVLLTDGSPSEAGSRFQLKSVLQDCDSNGGSMDRVEGLHRWALSTLRDCMGANRSPGDTAASPTSRRISEHLSHLIEDGGAVLILRVDDAERQRRAARTLLDSKCEFLLTHEATVRHN